MKTKKTKKGVGRTEYLICGFIIWVFAWMVIINTVPKLVHNIQDTLNYEPKETKLLSPISERKQPIKKADKRVEILEQYLGQYNTPLASISADIVKYSDEYKIDYRIIPSIAGIESTFCKNYPPESNNCFGYMAPGGGVWQFNHLSDAVRKVAWSIATRPQYKTWQENKKDYWELARVYNGGNQKKWQADLEYFISEVGE